MAYVACAMVSRRVDCSAFVYVLPSLRSLLEHALEPVVVELISTFVNAPLLRVATLDRNIILFAMQPGPIALKKPPVGNLYKVNDPCLAYDNLKNIMISHGDFDPASLNVKMTKPLLRKAFAEYGILNEADVSLIYLDQAYYPKAYAVRHLNCTIHLVPSPQLVKAQEMNSAV